MPDPIPPLVTDLTQVCVVVRDLEATMKSFVELAGIGPWAVYDFAPPDVADIRLRGEPVEATSRIAIAWSGAQMWEIIQPVTGRSIFQEFLDENGEGVQHVLVKHAGREFDDVVAHFEGRGCPAMMTCVFRGTRFAFLDTRGPLKMILEVFERPPHAVERAGRPVSEPSSWYPHRPEA
jgi:hypothetical protein